MKRMMIGGLITVFVGIILIFLLFSIWSPRNSPFKAPEMKKPIYTSSQMPCELLNGWYSGSIGDTIPILLYHYVEVVPTSMNDSYREQLSITPVQFEQQVASIAAEYEPIYMSEIRDVQTGLKKTCKKPIVLTFDDGYEDFYIQVYPILAKYKLKATVYLIVNRINQPDFLTDLQIRELLMSGFVEIGSHSLDHIDLKDVSGGALIRQVAGSKSALEGRYGVPVRTFSYPLGAVNNAVQRAVSDAGYGVAVTTQKGEVSRDTIDFFALPRVRAEHFEISN